MTILIDNLNLKFLRKEKMTQDEFAQKISLSRGTIQSWESEGNNVVLGFEIRNKICSILDCLDFELWGELPKSFYSKCFKINNFSFLQDLIGFNIVKFDTLGLPSNFSTQELLIAFSENLDLSKKVKSGQKEFSFKDDMEIKLTTKNLFETISNEGFEIYYNFVPYFKNLWFVNIGLLLAATPVDPYDLETSNIFEYDKINSITPVESEPFFYQPSEMIELKRKNHLTGQIKRLKRIHSDYLHQQEQLKEGGF